MRLAHIAKSFFECSNCFSLEGVSIVLKSQTVANDNQKKSRSFDEKEDPHRVNLNDLISRKKEAEKASRKTSVIVYSLGVFFASIVILIYQFLK